MTHYKLASLLLQYPTAELVAAREDIAGAVAELPGSASKAALERFLSSWRQAPLGELQREYVDTFDFDRRASLHLTFHTHGDRRRRGLELVRLKRRFAEAGLPLTGSELPDYLPVLLEFAELARDGAGEALLAELRGPLELVRRALHRKGSPYAYLVDAICAGLPNVTAKQLAELERLAADGPPTELVGLEPPAPLGLEPAGAAGGVKP